jgi:hypothetical protein
MGLLLCVSVAGVEAQTPAPSVARIKVFIDCKMYWDCDFEYFRTNLTFVDHVRDREVADVHVLITGQGTGAGGSQATLAFLGRGGFKGVDDTLTYTSVPNEASDVTRKGLVQRINIGLMRYVGHSDAAGTVQISTAPATAKQAQTPTHDPWNFWVMRLRVNGSMSGESSSKYSSFSGGASANRVTSAWKINLSTSASYRQSEYDLGDGDWYKSITRDSSVSGLAVKSLGPQWSAGGRASLRSSTYSNNKHSINVSPAIEHNFFPYAESTRRTLTLQYAIGVSALAYREMTLYDKMSETLGAHSLTLDLEARQPWGQLSVGANVTEYLPLTDKYRAEVFGNVDWKIRKGLSLNFSGGTSLIRDQLSLPKGVATTEEILVRQRQLATSYNYYFYFGVSYTFGSIFNNVVNSRFNSGGGGGRVIFF